MCQYLLVLASHIDLILPSDRTNKILWCLWRLGLCAEKWQTIPSDTAMAFVGDLYWRGQVKGSRINEFTSWIYDRRIYYRATGPRVPANTCYDCYQTATCIVPRFGFKIPQAQQRSVLSQRYKYQGLNVLIFRPSTELFTKWGQCVVYIS